MKERKFIKKEKGEFHLIEGGMKLNLSIDDLDWRLFIKSLDCVYPYLTKLLSIESLMGLQMYLAYKSFDKKEFILKILKKLKYKKDYSFIYEWFEIFEKIDKEGNFEGIIIPISKHIHLNVTDKYIKEQFTEFVKILSDMQKIDEPISIGDKKIAIIRVGEKEWGRYIQAIHFYKSQGCKIIILCGRGGFISKVAKILEISKLLFTDLKKDTLINTSTFSFKETKPCSVIYIILFFV